MKTPVKSVAIIGSTGSIGANTLKVIRAHPGKFRIVALVPHPHFANVDSMGTGSWGRGEFPRGDGSGQGRESPRAVLVLGGRVRGDSARRSPVFHRAHQFLLVEEPPATP